jgi:hypothetical protein
MKLTFKDSFLLNCSTNDLLFFRITFEPETGKCTLLIVEVFPQDAGEYRCIAVNERGKAISRATLEVECKFIFQKL